MSRPFRLLLIGDSDSQLLACESLCRFPAELAVEVTINAIPRNGTPAPILRRAQALALTATHEHRRQYQTHDTARSPPTQKSTEVRLLWNSLNPDK